MIASALRKIITNFQFQKKSQSWRAASSNTTDFWEGEKMLTWSMTTFKKNQSFWWSSRPFRPVQCFLTRRWRLRFRHKTGPSTWDSSRECPWRFVQDEVTRFWKTSNCIGISHERLRTLDRQHIDQMIRTRNVEAQNERIETGVFSKKRERSQRWQESGRMLSVCSRGDAFWTTGPIVVKKHNRPLLLDRRRHRLTEENHRKI